MADVKKNRVPDVNLKIRTRFNEPVRITVYVLQHYAIIYKSIFTQYSKLEKLAVRKRKFTFGSDDRYYFQMVMVIGKNEFLAMNQVLHTMEKLTGLSSIWFDFENPNNNSD